MKYLGIDYGSKRIGVALSDAEGMIAFPRTTISNNAISLSELTKLIEEENVSTIVIGDTRAFSGSENPITKESEEFMGQLQRATELPIVTAFEVWSSVEASRYAPKGHEHDDAAAAAIILQRYLDMKGTR